MIKLNEAGSKDRIIFFVMGALLATIAYIVGAIDSTNAEDDKKVFSQDVLIKGSLLVTDADTTRGILLRADDKDSSITVCSDFSDLKNSLQIIIATSEDGGAIGIQRKTNQQTVGMSIIENNRSEYEPFVVIKNFEKSKIIEP